MIFGTGFPPFLGGPIEHIRRLGQDSCKTRLEELSEGGNDRFAPKSGWLEVSV